MSVKDEGYDSSAASSHNDSDNGNEIKQEQRVGACTLEPKAGPAQREGDGCPASVKEEVKDEYNDTNEPDGDGNLVNSPENATIGRLTANICAKELLHSRSEHSCAQGSAGDCFHLLFMIASERANQNKDNFTEDEWSNLAFGYRLFTGEYSQKEAGSMMSLICMVLVLCAKRLN